MVVLLRLILCGISSALRARINPLDEAVVTMRVWPNDLDLNVHANSCRYLSFMDVGRICLVIRMRIVRKVLARKWRPIVGGAMINYRRSLLPFEKFRVRSRVLCWDEKWFYFAHVVENRRGEICAEGTVRGLIRGPGGNVPPSEFIALSGQPVEPPPVPRFVARWREVEREAH